MTPSCAFDAHSSRDLCAFYAHDKFVRLLHYWGMDVEWFKSRKSAERVTDRAIAEALGVERSVANKIMNGKVALDPYKADKVAALLKASPEEILYRAGVPISPPADAASEALLTATFEALLESLEIDPREDERAQKLASSFPGALRDFAAARQRLADGARNARAAEALAPVEGQPTQ